LVLDFTGRTDILDHMSTTWVLTNRPKHTEFVCFDCHVCGHEELGRPVFVTNGSTTIAVGTGCAANLIGEKFANVEAQIAATRLAELFAADDLAERAWRDFAMCLPQRVTPKFIRDTAKGGLFRIPVETVEAVAALYKPINRVGMVRRWQELVVA
jgi:hypothetical protein